MITFVGKAFLSTTGRLIYKEDLVGLLVLGSRIKARESGP